MPAVHVAGGGATETSGSSGPDPAAQALISRRLAVGGAISVGLLAFALVPTKDLRLRPQQPLYFYITQLLQAQVWMSHCHMYQATGPWTHDDCECLKRFAVQIRGGVQFPLSTTPYNAVPASLSSLCWAGLLIAA
jgi:hypothetical protein